jgi:hypothetical protein
MKIWQDGMDLHRLMAQVQAIIEKQVEQQKTFEKMVIANGILESTQVSEQQHLCWLMDLGFLLYLVLLQIDFYSLPFTNQGICCFC